jgi:hypothetical protein
MTIEVNWCRLTADAAYPYIHHKADGKYPLMFEPEEVKYPNSKARYHACPSFGSVQQYLIKSPFYGTMEFDKQGVRFPNSEHLQQLVRFSDEPHHILATPYFQFNVTYLFWSKEETYLWVEDSPRMYDKNYREWSVIKGMVPIHEVYRPVHPAIVMKDFNSKFTIDREDPLFSVTLFSPKGRIKLIEKEPSEDVLAKSISSTKASSFCPYKWSTSLFKKWFN